MPVRIDLRQREPNERLASADASSDNERMSAFWETILIGGGLVLVIAAVLIYGEVVTRRRKAAERKQRARFRRRYRKQWSRSGQREEE